MFLQVSFYLSRADVTVNTTSGPYTYAPTTTCVGTMLARVLAIALAFSRSRET